MSDEITPNKTERRGLFVTLDSPTEFAGGSVVRKHGLLRNIVSRGQRAGLGRRVAIVLMVCAVAFGLGTFFALTGNTTLAWAKTPCSCF